MFKFVAKALKPRADKKDATKKGKKKRSPGAAKKKRRPAVDAPSDGSAKIAPESGDASDGLDATLRALEDELVVPTGDGEAPAEAAPAGEAKSKEKRGKKQKKDKAAKPAKAAASSERQKLIEEALAVQRSKAHVFDNLSDEEKQRLHALAVKTLLRQGKGNA